MSPGYRFAACNELFQKLPFPEACAQIHRAGYSGIELAPFTLAPDATTLTDSQRAEIRRTMADHNLDFVGLHWLLASPEGLHATTADATIRRATWDFLRHLTDLCSDLDGSLMIFGSPKQRSATHGRSPADATAVFIEELARLAPHASSRSVTILVEPLSPDQTNVVTSLEEAVSIVKQIASPAIQTMFDTHNAVAETTPHPELLRRYLPYIRHVHVNEMDGREPGTGDYDFAALLATLAAENYHGWISLEAFDFTRDPYTVAAAALHHLTPILTNPL